jgi:hypothetical protein
MIALEGKEWDSFVSDIENIKTKSNRQVLCLKCWSTLNYEQKVRHLKQFPSHTKHILTSAKFASGKQIV